MNRSPLLRAFLLIPLVLACFALSPQARAVCQEGCLTNQNTALGDDALLNNAGDNNTAVGFDALLNNTTGFFNTAVGANALNANTVGIENTAIGNQALFFNTTGGFNTALGHAALQANTSGESNTAIGWAALADNVTGGGNTAVGESALIGNTGGSSNTAVGNLALGQNTTANFNTATGTAALETNHTGSNNAAYGFDALQLNKKGSNNTAVGSESLRLNKHGENNTCFGYTSLYNCEGNNNTAIGTSAGMNNRSGSNNIALGVNAGINLTTGDNNIDIGNVGFMKEANHIRIGTVGTQIHTFIAGISRATVPTGVAVIVDADGHLGTTTSSARYKEAIKPMDKASEAILALKPVTFHYNHELDPKRVPQFGLVAEDVAKINPDLVARDDEGKLYTVRYEAVNAMLLNEFLKEHRKVEEQQATIAELKLTVAQQQKGFQSRLACQQKQIEALTAGLQKVTAEVVMSRPAPQTLVDNH